MRISDWSSDVCSSDLAAHPRARGRGRECGRSDRIRSSGFGLRARQSRTRSPPTRCLRLGGAKPGGSLVEHAIDIAVTVIGAEALGGFDRSEEHTSELQSLMRISYAVFCLKKKTKQ